MVIPPPSSGAQEVSRAVEELPWTGAGEKALDAYRRARESDYPDARGWFKIGLTLYDGRYYQQATEAFEKCQACSGSDSSLVSVAITWQGHLFDLLGRRDKAIECYKKALEQPVLPDVRHDQYKIRVNREWIEKHLEEPFRRE
jgi:tetratricopeptide (TPR) repeat protein